MTNETNPTDTSRPRAIEAAIEIQAPVEAVWKALTDAGELTNWFPLEARVNPGPGGSIWASWGEGMHFETPIDAWEENEHLRLVYSEPTGPHTEGPVYFEIPFRIAVDYHLEGKGGTTILRIVHSGFGHGEPWDSQYDGTVRGWDFELRGLKHYLENHRGTDRVVAHVKRPLHDIAFEDAWGRLFSSKGLAAEGTMDGVGPGERYRLKTSGGDVLEGTVQIHNPPRDLSATVETLNNGLLRLKVDPACMTVPQPELNVWLSTYGLPETETAALQDRLQKMVDHLFAELAESR